MFEAVVTRKEYCMVLPIKWRDHMTRNSSFDEYLVAPSNRYYVPQYSSLYEPSCWSLSSKHGNENCGTLKQLLSCTSHGNIVVVTFEWCLFLVMGGMIGSSIKFHDEKV